MKKIMILLVAVMVLTSAMWASASNDHEDSARVHSLVSLNKVELTLVNQSYAGSTENSMPWGSSLTFKAEVRWDDGIIASDDFAAVDWTVTDQKGNATQVWTKTWFDDWDGVARIKIFAPYGMLDSLKLLAISQKDPSLSSTKIIQVVDGSKTTGSRFFNGYLGSDPPATESWNSVSGVYSTKLEGDFDDITKYEGYIKGSLHWRVYMGEVEKHYVKYPLNSKVELNVDQYERCWIQLTWGMKQEPSVPPPGDYRKYKYYKSIGSLRADTIKEGVKISWNRVASASGYVIYRYDKKTKKYRKIGSNKGSHKTKWRIQNTFTDTKVAARKGYLYRVSSYKYIKGKVKISKKSGAASIIYRSNKYGNATRVNLTRTKAIKGKAGATVKLKANFSFESGKKPYSKTVRWYTNNKKIATVSKSGVVKLRAKGKCALYAKAHNGLKSKKLVIQVI